MTTSFKQFSAPAMLTYSPKASKLLGRDHWQVMEPFRYYLGEKNSNSWVDVPTGYYTDGASVPRVFWGLLPPWGDYGQAAIVHDYLCEYLTIFVNNVPTKISRKRADEIFLEAMKVLGVPAYKRLPMYWAVSAYRIIARVSEPTLKR